MSSKLKVNKSHLRHYVYVGLITPIKTLGKMQIFDEKEAMKTIYKIAELQEKGFSLSQIKEKLIEKKSSNKK